VTRGQLPQRAGSLGLTAVGLPPRYPHPVTDLHVVAAKAWQLKDYYGHNHSKRRSTSDCWLCLVAVYCGSDGSGSSKLNISNEMPVIYNIVLVAVQ